MSVAKYYCLLKIMYCFCCRGQEQHIRYEHIYLPEASGQPEVEYAEIKRPRLEIPPESLMRPSTHRQPLPLGVSEDLTKVSVLSKLHVHYNNDEM